MTGTAVITADTLVCDRVVFAELVGLAVTRTYADSRCRSLQTLYYLRIALVLAASVEVKFGKRMVAPLVPGLGPPAGINAKTALKEVPGWDVARVRHEFRRADREEGIEAQLPAEVRDALIPPDLLDLAVAWAAEGAVRQELPLRRWELAVDHHAETRDLARDTARQHLRPGRRLAKNLHRVAREHPQGELLGTWELPPRPLRMPDIHKPPRRKRPVARGVMEAALARLVNELARRLDCRPGQELQAIEAMSRSELARRSPFRATRNLAMLATHAETAERAFSLCQPSNADFDPARVMYDGRARPSLSFRPGKDRPPEEVEVQGLGARCGHYIAVFQAVKAKLVRCEADDALFPGTLRKPASSLTYSGWRSLISGLGPTASRGGIRSLLTGDDNGPQTHRIRDAALQHLRSADGKAWLAEHYPDYEARVVAEALAGHKIITTDIYGYFGYNTVDGRELLSAIGAECLEARYFSEVRDGVGVYAVDEPALSDGEAKLRYALARSDARAQELQGEIEYLRAELTRMRTASEPSSPPSLREPAFVTLPELAELTHLSQTTLKRWRRFGIPCDAQPQLWAPGSDPSAPWSTPRRQAFLVEELNLADLPSDMLARLDALQSTMPSGWAPVGRRTITADTVGGRR